jgi:endo-1,4-beta-mannosidase
LNKDGFLKSKGITAHSKVPLQAWIEEMAAYVKALDSKHLVTVGTEGFYGPGRAERLDANPGNWAASLCSNFIQNSVVKHIDFASVHAYPDSWSVFFFFFVFKHAYYSTFTGYNWSFYRVIDEFQFSRLPKASVEEKNQVSF